MARFFKTCPTFLIVLIGLPAIASAHVKWFAPYIIEASPRPIGYTLTDIWFWTGLALVLVFFIVTRLVEGSRLGIAIQGKLDRLTDPLWPRLDDFIRVVIGVFFVAIFAVG